MSVWLMTAGDPLTVPVGQWQLRLQCVTQILSQTLSHWQLSTFAAALWNLLDKNKTMLKGCVEPDVALITLDHAAAGWSIAVAVAFVRKRQQRLLTDNAGDLWSDVILQQLRRCWITYTSKNKYIVTELTFFNRKSYPQYCQVSSVECS